MTGSVALDVVISLVFIYLLYSLLATIIQEIIAANILGLRAKNLEKAIQRMLDDNTGTTFFSKAFYCTPIIRYLADKDSKKPAYLASRNFSKAILDLLKGKDTKPGEDFRAKIDQSLDPSIGITFVPSEDSPSTQSSTINGGDSYKFLQSLWADSQGDIEKFRLSLEQWFDDTMERASGWYKKKIQFILLIIGFALAFIFNIDTIEIVGKLSSDPKLTAQLVQQANNFIKAHPNLKAELEQQKQDIDKLIETSKSDSIEKIQDKDSLNKVAEEHYQALKKQQNLLLTQADSLVKNDIKNVNAILGTGINKYQFKGKSCTEHIGYFLLSLLGWAITALAISLGAPFWFDLLNKLMKLRTSIATSSTPEEDKSKTAGSTKSINPKG